MLIHTNGKFKTLSLPTLVTKKLKRRVLSYEGCVMNTVYVSEWHKCNPLILKRTCENLWHVPQLQLYTVKKGRKNLSSANYSSYTLLHHKRACKFFVRSLTNVLTYSFYDEICTTFFLYQCTSHCWYHLHLLNHFFYLITFVNYNFYNVFAVRFLHICIFFLQLINVIVPCKCTVS